MFAGISKTILIVLLLLCQGSVLAHELDLDAHQSSDTCEICLLHSALDDALISSVAFHFSAAHHLQDSSYPILALSNRAPRYFHARAPPIFTFV